MTTPEVRRATARFLRGGNRRSPPPVVESPEDSQRRAALRRARRFQGDLARHVRRYHPHTFAAVMAMEMDRTLGERRRMTYAPPHTLLHLIAANCAYHRPPYRDAVKGPALASLFNFHNRYHDPTSQWLLERRPNPMLWYIFVARQQFPLQGSPDFYDVGRNVLLFDERHYPRAAALMRGRYGFGFREWALFCFALYSGVVGKVGRAPVVEERYFRSSRSTLGRHERLSAMYDLLAVTVEEVRDQYHALRAREGHLLHDPALPTPFVERPLLRVGPGAYIAVHKPLIFARGLEGPYDIAMAKGHWPEVFGGEFGTAFESYTGAILRYLPGVALYGEREMRAFTEAKICDYLVVGADFLLFVECKAVKYSATLVSEGAVRGDNSTRKVAGGMDQIYSAATLVRAGVLDGLIGPTASRAFVAAVVTFRPLYGANDDTFWGEVIQPAMRAPGKADWARHFAFRPQMLDIAAFERLVLVCDKEGTTPAGVFASKLGGPSAPPLVTGDWGPYLAQRLGRGRRLPILTDAFTAFTTEAMRTFPEPDDGAFARWELRDE